MRSTQEIVHEDTPATVHQLMYRARALAGWTLGEIATALGEPVPADLKRAKGWAGGLLERCLGATAGNRAVPDFEALGVEMKTLPVNAAGRPLETTYVTTVPLLDLDELEWNNSPVLHKLSSVLWVPIHAERSIPPGNRMVGRAVLWQPSEAETQVLQDDWESHIKAIRDGCVEGIRGGDGTVMQVRPKAADSRKLTRSVDERGESIMTLPRGFYLRTLFTEQILRYGMLPDEFDEQPGS